MSKQYERHRTGAQAQTTTYHSSQTPRTMIGNQSTESLLSGQASPSAENLGRKIDLPGAIRSKMETSFGADLSGVQLYESQAVADAGANAVTMGSKIAFAPGKLDFASQGGQALLGHELSHAISQARGEVSGAGFLNDHALEARADREGALAAAGETVYSGPVTPLSASSVTAAAGPMQAKKISDEDRFNYANERLNSSIAATKSVNDEIQTQASAAKEKADAFVKSVASGNYTQAERDESANAMQIMSGVYRNRMTARDEIMAEILAEDKANGTFSGNEADYEGNQQMRTAIALSQVSTDKGVTKNILRSLMGAGASTSGSLNENLSQDKKDKIAQAMNPVVQDVLNFDIDSLNLDDISTLTPHTDFLSRMAAASQGISDLGKTNNGILFGGNQETHDEVKSRVAFMNGAYKQLEQFHLQRMLAGKDGSTQVEPTHMPNTSQTAMSASSLLTTFQKPYATQMSLLGGAANHRDAKVFLNKQAQNSAVIAQENKKKQQLRKARENIGTQEKPKYKYDVSQIPEDLRMEEPQKKWWQFWK